MLRDLLKGVLFAIIASFPLAAIIGLLYRFPVPFAGYMSGVGALIMAPQAVLFYGILGGFVVLGVGGAVAGLLVSRFVSDAAKGERGRKNRLIAAYASLFTLLCLLVLAILDKLIGPW